MLAEKELTAAFAVYGGKERLVDRGIRVLPFFEEQDVPLLRILTDRGSEFCGNRESHEYVLYLDLENIEHSRTKVKVSPTA